MSPPSRIAALAPLPRKPLGERRRLTCPPPPLRVRARHGRSTREPSWPARARSAASAAPSSREAFLAAPGASCVSEAGRALLGIALAPCATGATPSCASGAPAEAVQQALALLVVDLAGCRVAELSVDPGQTVMAAKQRISDESGVALENQRLVCGTQVLDGAAKLGDCFPEGERKFTITLVRVAEPSAGELGLALHAAVDHGDATAVTRLLDRRADAGFRLRREERVGPREVFEEETPLYCAVRRGSLEVVRHLLENGAEVNGVQYRGGLAHILMRRTCFRASQSEQMRELLRAHGAENA